MISGYLQFEKGELPGLPADTQKTMFLFVESVRALARNSMVCEQIYKTSKENNVTIVPQDFPNLFTHSETPMGNFIRKLVCNLQELDWDILVWRLVHG